MLYLKALDQRLFIYLNSRHNAFFDVIMYCASNQLFWIPFYIWLAIIIYQYFKRVAYYIYFYVVALIIASDQLSSNWIKNLVQRPRPSHNPELTDIIHLSPAGPGGLYGFVSSHASNSFALAVFLTLVLPTSFKPVKRSLLFWAALVSYSRIYNGVHYPGDVLAGAALGTAIAWLLSIPFKYFLGSYLLLIKKYSG